MEPEYMFTGHSSPGDSGERLNNPLAEKLLGPESGEFDAEQQNGAAGGLVDGNQLSNSNVILGEKQPNQYRDIWAALLFVVCQCTLLYFSLFWGVPALNKWMSSGETDHSDHEDSNHSTGSFIGTVWLVLTCSIVAFFIAGAAMAVLLRFAQQLIQISLMATVASLVVLSVFFLTQALWWAMLASLFFVAISALYTAAVWRRVPFAAANMQVAITAIQTNGGLVLTAVGVTFVVNGFWTVLWVLAWLGVYAHSMVCTTTSDNGQEEEHCVGGHTNTVAMIALLLIYTWTIEVANNLLRVTTAGVVGTFWFAPNDAGTYFSPAVTDSFLRAATFSFGSICFGSLLTSVVQGFHSLVVSLKQAQGGRVSNELLLCVLECITAFLERLVVFVNRWSFCYVGLYGYDYLTAGKKVTDLLMDRGWTAIINDSLVTRVLMLVSLVVGAATGVVGLLLVDVRPLWVGEWGATTGLLVAFFVPATIGTAMAQVLMSTVVSAVDTVVVAFAEAPLEFERNHPGLSAQLVAAWRLVYPEEYSR